MMIWNWISKSGLPAVGEMKHWQTSSGLQVIGSLSDDLRLVYLSDDSTRYLRVDEMVAWCELPPNLAPDESED